jgi:hypothetical protein
MQLFLFKVIGVIIVIDGVLSVLWAYEPRLLWQAGRFVRISLGIILIVLAFYKGV